MIAKIKLPTSHKRYVIKLKVVVIWITNDYDSINKK